MAIFASRRWIWVLLAAGVLGVYLLTLSPGIVGGDPGELQFVPSILSMPHPTGTPLYVLLGKAWSMLPLGPTVAWRMNLLAAVSAALAVVVIYVCVYGRVRHPIPALSAALSLAFGLTFWEQALLADKYAFNALMVALVIYLALRWGETRSPRTLGLLALAYGLSLAHHRTMALFGPALLGYVWWQGRPVLGRWPTDPLCSLWRHRRAAARLAALCLVPLALYFYLPWAEARGLPPGTWHPRTLQQWYDYLFDTGRTGLVYVDPGDLGQVLLFYLRTWQRDFTWAGVLLGLGGLAWQFRRRPADVLFLLANFILQGFLAANHHVPRHWVYFIPSFVIWAVWVGEGVGVLWQIASRALGRIAVGPPAGAVLRYVPLSFLAVAMLVWPLLPFRERYRPLREAHLGAGVLDVWRQTLKQGTMGDRIGWAIANVEPDAVIVCDWEQATPLWYVQQVEKVRPDVEIIYPIERLDEAAGWGRPLYLARAHPGLADRWYPSGSDSLIALQTEPASDVPSGAAPLGVRVGRKGDSESCFELAGFAYGQAMNGVTSFRPPEVVPLTLYWRSLCAPGNGEMADYSVSLRLLDSAGAQVFQVDSQHPVLGTYPTSRWHAGEVIGDYYEIQLSPDLAPGTYQWGVILYRALPEGGWESLVTLDTGAELIPGGPFQVAQSNLTYRMFHATLLPRGDR